MKRTIDGRTILSIQVIPVAIKVEKGENSSMNFAQSIVDKKWMDKEEVKEKHLVAAIKNKEHIPTPDIITIDEISHNKLYPATYERPKWRIFDEAPHELVEYDMDDEDEKWLENLLPFLKISTENFERYMDYLESNSKCKVPTVDQFKAAFRNQESNQSLENVYDYWMDKKFKHNGKPLMYTHKVWTKQAAKSKKYDPYISFRPCQEKMFLRRNRKLDAMNYHKMLHLRKVMVKNVEQCKKEFITRLAQNQMLKNKFDAFHNLYIKRNYDEFALDRMPCVSSEELIKNFNGNRKFDCDAVSSKHDDVTLESIKMFDFHHTSGNEYLKPLQNLSLSPQKDEKQKFYTTDKQGYHNIRLRIGRGGRRIIDRILRAPTQSPEYHEVNINAHPFCVKFKPFNYELNTTSSFRLCETDKTIHNTVDGNNNENNDNYNNNPCDYSCELK